MFSLGAGIAMLAASSTAQAQGDPGSKSVGINCSGTSDGTPVRVTIVPNLGSRLVNGVCTVLGGSDVGTASNCEFPHAPPATAPFDGVISSATLHPTAGQQGCIGTTDRRGGTTDIKDQLNGSSDPIFGTSGKAFLNLSLPPTQLVINHIGTLQPPIQWDMCINGIKVASQIPTTDASCNPVYPGTPAFAASGPVNGVTYTGIKKGKHPVPAMSWVGALAVSVLMLGLGYIMIRHKRRGLST